MKNTGSRYEDAKRAIFKFVNENNLKRGIVFNPKIYSIDDLGRNFSIHTTKQGEQLDLIAENYGGEGKFVDWWKLAQVNNIKYPLEIGSGIRLVIPSKNIFSNIRKITEADL